MLVIAIFPCKANATSWAYPFVVWDNYIYVMSDENVKNIDKEIGEVTKYSDMEQYGGNFSNVYPKGTKYYSIVGINTDDTMIQLPSKLETISILKPSEKAPILTKKAIYTISLKVWGF